MTAAITRLHPITPDAATAARIADASKVIERRYPAALGALLIDIPLAVAAYQAGDDEDLRKFLSHALGALSAINPFG